MKFKSLLMAALLLIITYTGASAATPNPSPGSPGYELIPIQISGQWTATTTSVVKFQLPYPAYLIHFSATARASGGTSPTLTVDLKEGGTSKLSTPLAVTAGTVGTAVIGTTPRMADESTITIDLNIGGTSPTWNDITVLMLIKRL